MSQSTFTSERTTAIVSTLVAVAILAAGVTAHQSRAPLDKLEQLESDLQFQLDWAFRHDSKERSQRIASLEETIAAWQASPRTQEDRKLLASWLLESTIRSMPGTTQPLPSLPKFGKPKAVSIAVTVEPVPTENKVVKLTAATNVAMQAIPKTTPTDNVAVDNVVVADSELFAQPRGRLTEVPVKATETPVKINLTELAARIAGYHEGLDRIETALLLANSPDLDFLEKQAQKLDDLTRDFRFVKLYHVALSEQERKNISAPRWMNATLAEIERFLQRNESQQDGDFLGSFDPDQRQRIENIRQQLAAIAARKA